MLGVGIIFLQRLLIFYYQTFFLVFAVAQYYYYSVGGFDTNWKSYTYIRTKVIHVEVIIVYLLYTLYVYTVIKVITLLEFILFISAAYTIRFVDLSIKHCKYNILYIIIMNYQFNYNIFSLFLWSWGMTWHFLIGSRVRLFRIGSLVCYIFSLLLPMICIQ